MSMSMNMGSNNNISINKKSGQINKIIVVAADYKDAKKIWDSAIPI